MGVGGKDGVAHLGTPSSAVSTMVTVYGRAADTQASATITSGPADFTTFLTSTSALSAPDVGPRLVPVGLWIAIGVLYFVALRLFCGAFTIYILFGRSRMWNGKKHNAGQIEREKSRREKPKSGQRVSVSAWRGISTPIRNYVKILVESADFCLVYSVPCSVLSGSTDYSQ